MTEKKGYDPSDEEAEAIDRAGLNAAWEALAPLRSEKLAGMSNWDQLMVIIGCFSAAREGTKRAERDLLRKHPEADYVAHYEDETNIACSAIYGLSFDSIEDISPISIGGNTLRTLMRAAQIMNALGDIDMTVDIDAGANIGGAYLTELLAAHLKHLGKIHEIERNITTAPPPATPAEPPPQQRTLR